MADLCEWLAGQPDEPDPAAWAEATRLARNILGAIVAPQTDEPEEEVSTDESP